MTKKLILNLRIMARNENHDIEVSDEITAHELVYGLNEAYNLGIDTNDIAQSFCAQRIQSRFCEGTKNCTSLVCIMVQ